MGVYSEGTNSPVQKHLVIHQSRRGKKRRWSWKRFRGKNQKRKFLRTLLSLKMFRVPQSLHRLITDRCGENGGAFRSLLFESIKVINQNIAGIFTFFIHFFPLFLRTQTKAWHRCNEQRSVCERVSV